MSQTVRLFTNGRSQAVRLPAAYRFDVKEVFIRQDAETGDVILSRRPTDWSGFLELIHAGAVPEGFLSPPERTQSAPTRDLCW